jgi:hypothetical protein
MRSIFIAYRREDTAMAAGRLHGDLEQEFGADKVFRDKEAIRGGERWAERIRKEIGRNTLMLVLIGPHWLEAKGALGQRRLDDPADTHRQEIEIAIAQGATIIPVLVENAVLPSAEKLPASLQALPQYQILKLRDDDWNNDFLTLKNHLASAPGLKSRHPDGPRSIKAIVAIVLCVLGFAMYSQDTDEETLNGVALVGTIALILGILAWQDVRNQRMRGRGMAISAAVLGGIELLAAIGNLTTPTSVTPLMPPIPDKSVVNPLVTPVQPQVAEVLNLSGEWRDGVGYPVSIQHNGNQVSMYSSVMQVQFQGVLTGAHIEGAFYPAAGGMPIGTGAFDVDPSGGMIRGNSVVWGQPSMVVLVRSP